MIESLTGRPFLGDWEAVERCPVCESDAGAFQPFEQVRDQGVQLVYMICQHCGLIMQTPRPTSSSLEAYYRDSYRLQVQGVEGPTEKDLRIQAGRARHLTGLLEAHTHGVSTHLDIGSSSGALLRTIRRATGCESYGVEPGASYRRFSQASGLEIYASLDELPKARQNSYDLISMIHVLEHVYDPAEYLEKLRLQWLRPDGWLLVEVPNVFGHHALELSHIYAFSAETLRYVLRRSGYRVLLTKTHGEPRSGILPLYVTMLAAPDDAVDRGTRPVVDVRAVRRRRRRANLARRMLSRYLPWITWRRLPESENPYTGPQGSEESRS